MVLAKADMIIAGRYASLASGPDAARDLARASEAEHDRTVEQMLAINGHARLLDNMPVPAPLDRPAQPVRRLAVRSCRCACSTASAVCRQTTRSGATCSGSSI